MFKKALAIVLPLTMLLCICPPVSAEKEVDPTLYSIESTSVADEQLNEDNVVIIQDQRISDMINQLFAKRCELETDFEANQEEIDKIDYQLSQLGVETIPYSEVLAKISSDLQPNVSFTSNDPNSRWTSRREIVRYAGYAYELQIIEGVPLNKYSFLKEHQAEVSFSKSRIIAGATEVFGVITLEALGAVPVIDELADGISFLTMLTDAGRTIYESVQPSTILEDVSGVALITLSSHVKIIYVKGSGSSDAYQKPAYFGNHLTVKFSTLEIADGPMGEHGSETIHEPVLETSFTACSAYFSDLTIPVKNYRNYIENNMDEYTPDYTMHSITLNVFDTSDFHFIPLASPRITETT